MPQFWSHLMTKGARRNRIRNTSRKNLFKTQTLQMIQTLKQKTTLKNWPHLMTNQAMKIRLIFQTFKRIFKSTKKIKKKFLVSKSD